MRFDNRRIITHLLFLAVGLAVGIYLARSGDQAQVAEVSPSEADTGMLNTPGSLSGNVNAGPNPPMPPATEAAAGLVKLREEYEEQIRKGESRQALLILQDMEMKASSSQIYLELNSDYQIYVKDWRAAAVAANKCTASFPKSRLCFRNLGTAEMQDGSSEEQVAAVDACLALEPNDPQCRNMKGMVLMNGGDYSGAVATYEKLIRDNGSFGVRFPDDHLEWQLGLALEGAGRREEAIDHLENACRRNNNQACKKIEELSADP